MAEPSNRRANYLLVVAILLAAAMGALWLLAPRLLAYLQ